MRAAIAVGLMLWGAAVQAHFITIGSWKGQTAEERAIIEVIAAISANDRMPATVRLLPSPREALGMVGLGGLEFAVIDLEAARAAHAGSGPLAGPGTGGLRLVAVLGRHAVVSNDQVFGAMDHHLASLIHAGLDRFRRALPDLAGIRPADLAPADAGMPFARGAARYWREAGLLD
ncbi:MAG: hypothetical protein D6686_03600 [Alphaproteobacteria bacterium]|nr:MAG: hypothetical protein D6686_03600 [Alphaproteobacteria bacterium]